MGLATFAKNINLTVETSQKPSWVKVVNSVKSKEAYNTVWILQCRPLRVGRSATEAHGSPPESYSPPTLGAASQPAATSLWARIDLGHRDALCHERAFFGASAATFGDETERNLCRGNGSLRKGGISAGS